MLDETPMDEVSWWVESTQSSNSNVSLFVIVNRLQAESGAWREIMVLLILIAALIVAARLIYCTGNTNIGNALTHYSTPFPLNGAKHHSLLGTDRS